MYKDILDKIVWSFSSVNNYCTCPYGFKLSYIEKKSKVDNAFAEFGGFVHSLLEKYFKGEVEFFELATLYEEEYNINVLHSFPEFKFCDLADKYYQSGLEYFKSFEGLSDRYEILGVEQKINLTIKNKPFVGYIDLILKDKNDGQYVIVDHKSKSKFKNKKEKEHYLLQLYLYSLYIKEQYGTYPKSLKFNMFRAKDWVSEDFEESRLEDAINWFDITTDLIYSDTTFPKNKDDFFCKNLCGVRKHCKEG